MTLKQQNIIILVVAYQIYDNTDISAVTMKIFLSYFDTNFHKWSTDWLTKYWNTPIRGPRFASLRSVLSLFYSWWFQLLGEHTWRCIYENNFAFHQCRSERSNIIILKTQMCPGWNVKLIRCCLEYDFKLSWRHLGNDTECCCNLHRCGWFSLTVVPDLLCILHVTIWIDRPEQVGKLDRRFG